MVPLERVQHWESSSLPANLPTRPQLRAISRVTRFPLPPEWNVVVRRGARPLPAMIDQGTAATVADEIRAIARVLAADGFSTAEVARRNATVFSYRYGTSGTSVALTTRAVATRARLTDEVVRQISVAIAPRRGPASRVAQVPALRRLTKHLPRYAGSTLARADRDLRRLLGHRLSIADAVRFGVEVLGKEPPIAFGLRRRNVILVDA